MERSAWEARLRGSPELLALDIDPLSDRVEFRALPHVAYERASFLDRRLEGPVALSAPFAQVAAAAAGLGTKCDFIFHIGHVGSTLMSRLLGVHPALFGVREPQALRTLAQAELDASPWGASDLRVRLDVFLTLYARTWTAEAHTMLKATSLVGELAGGLLDLRPQARALLMTTSPEVYLATLLSGPNSRVELGDAAPNRLARLQRRLGADPWPVGALSIGELAAMSWACEMSALDAAAARHPTRVRWIDFDAFLAAPADGLAGVLTFLGLDSGEDRVAAVLRSGYLERYSKAPEYAYGPQLRREVLAAGRTELGAEIAKGMRWLEAAAQWPQIAAALTQESLRRDA